MLAKAAPAEIVTNWLTEGPLIIMLDGLKTKSLLRAEVIASLR
jgi:hypothetical protein